LRNDQVQQPVAGRGQRVASSAGLRAEDLGRIPVKRVSAAISLQHNGTDDMYTQVMMPIIVKKNENTKFIATIARRAFSFEPVARSFPAT